MNCILYAQLNIRGYSLTDCTELMIETSTRTPTFPSIFKSLYLHNVWCLHQHKSNSDASIKAGLVGHGQSLRKGCIPTVLLGLGPELRIFYLFMSFLRRTSGCLVSAEQDRNSILPGTCLAEWLIRVQAACWRTVDKAFCWGKIHFEKSLHAAQVIKVWFWEMALFLKDINKSSGARWHRAMFRCRDCVHGQWDAWWARAFKMQVHSCCLVSKHGICSQSVILQRVITVLVEFQPSLRALWVQKAKSPL